MNYYKDIDRLPLAEIEKIQDLLLSETIGYAVENSAYYKGLFKRERLSADDIKGLSDIGKLPFTRREDIQEDNWAFLAVPRNEISEVVSTTGTTGTPAFIALTENDLERLACNEERNFGYAGAGKGDLFDIAVTCDNLFVAGIAYYSGLIKTGASVIRVGPQNVIRHFDLIRGLKPSGIVAVPSFMVRLVKHAASHGIDLCDLGLKKIVLIGDTIRNADFTNSAIGNIIESAFGTRCYSTYGITEAQLSFCECHMFRGLHSHPDFVLAEIIDDEGNIIADGEPGELVLTTLQVKGMPLIRYRTGDITFRISSGCGCGRNSVRIGPVLGRKNHRLKVKGVTLYPKTIENALLELKDVINYQIEAYTGADSTDQIMLRVGSYNNNKTFVSYLRSALKAKARVTPEVEIETPEEVEKRLFEGGSRKAINFRDRRIKDHG
jgi:phenylacetate-CoA ligase